jgi:hypothetical protein
MIEAWKSLFGNQPSKEQIAILMAQNDLETGHRKSMWNYNIGNIKAFKEWTGDYFNLTGDEVLKGKTVSVKDMRFRAYPSLIEGVKDYIKLLSTSQRYASAWQHILHPDPAAFSKALKQGGYYTASESDYTKLMSSLYSNFNKSKSYEAAVAGKVDPAKELEGSKMVAKTDEKDEKDSFLKKYISQLKGKEGDVFQELAEKHKAPTSSPAATKATPAASSNYNSILTDYLHQVAASEKSNKKLYKQFLPSQNIVIGINSKYYTDAVEFSRVLCTALDEELMAKAFIHTDNINVDVECVIPGPELECFETVKQLTQSLVLAFKQATIKIGGININTKFIMNKKSSYEGMTLHAAQTQYRKFLLKFI